MKQALERIPRTERTIYRWVRDGRVRTMQPLRVVWLNLTDLLKAESEARPGRPIGKKPEKYPRGG
jgi:hypothetical protein